MSSDLENRGLIIIPTYNERINIVKIIPQILEKSKLVDILVVDDSSPDGTADAVKSLQTEYPNIFLEVRKEKSGLGSAYVHGFRYALEKGYGFIFEMDADFSHHPDHIPHFFEAIQEADIVLGSRYKDGKISVVNWDWKRLLLSYLANIYTRFITGMPISDATGGFKCFRRRALESLDLNKVKSDGYSFQMEITYKMWKKKLIIKEIPIVFTDRTVGESKMSGKIISEALFVLLKLRFGIGE